MALELSLNSPGGSTLQQDAGRGLLCLAALLTPPRRRLCDQVGSAVTLSVCEQDYYKSDQPISLKLGAMIGPTNLKKLLTFGGDPVPDTDSGSLFGFPHHCGIGDFGRVISISHTVNGRFLRHSTN